MNRKCKLCRKSIPAGQAVVRSIAFEQVNFHVACFHGTELPAQRESALDARLAAARRLSA